MIMTKNEDNLLFDQFVACVPPTCTKQSCRVVRLPSGRVRSYQPARVRKAETTILSLFLPYAPAEPYTGPLGVQVVLVYPWRKSESKKNQQAGRKWKCTRPDLDNLAKLILDAMAPRFFRDDAEVCSISSSKQWGSKPGIRFKIAKLHG